MAGIFAGITDKQDSSTCFVMMPFRREFDGVYRLIQRCCEDQGLKCLRADEDVKPGKITNKIYRLVKSAGIVIADMTGRNPNVFYELGLAHAVHDNVILLTQSTDDVPFDLREFIHIPYQNSFTGAEKLASELSKVLTSILRSASPATATAAVAEAGIVEVTGDKEIPLEGAECIDDLAMLHLQAEIHRQSDNKPEAKPYLARALTLAQDGQGDADDIGNCAIEAELCGFNDLANALYKLALQKDPHHVNNRQCYVSFLLDNRAHDKESLEEAKKLLDELEKEPSRRERTRALQVQHMSLQAPGDDLDEDALLDHAIGEDGFTSLRQAVPALDLAQKLGRLDRMRQIVEQLLTVVSAGDAKDLHRILADALASRGDSAEQLEAVTIYEGLRAEGDHSPDMLHNLATLYFEVQPEGWRKKALEIWNESYAAKPNDPNIRQAFAQFLARSRQPEDAAKVLRGQPLEE